MVSSFKKMIIFNFTLFAVLILFESQQSIQFHYEIFSLICQMANNQISLQRMKEGFVYQKIIKTISFIVAKEKQMEAIRQDLNHQIMFNLKDTYISIAKNQAVINIKAFMLFLDISDHTQSLQKFIKWNNHNSSFNLTFAQFSALLISKQDRLLTKMVLEREQMGAIPNFLLQMVKSIVLKQIQIHQYCSNCEIGFDQQLEDWIDSVVDENGDLDQILFRQSIQIIKMDQPSQSSLQDILFLKYIQASGNITAERLKILWHNISINPPTYDYSFKCNKVSTTIQSPKSILSPKSLALQSFLKRQNLRIEFFDCINRPISFDSPNLRQTKSIEKHLNRINSVYKLNLINKTLCKNTKMRNDTALLLFKIRETIMLQRQIQHFRIELCLCTDFYPILFYESIPKDRNKKINATNLKDYLQSFGFSFNLNEIYYLFRRYANDRNKLVFNTFCSIFDVCQTQYKLLQKNRYVESLQDIDISTKKLYFQLLCMVIQTQIKINQIKINLYKSVNNLADTVAYLFQQYDNMINQQDLRNIYRNCLKLQINLKDIKLFWQRLGFNNPKKEYLRKQILIKQLTPDNLTVF